jgi:hypothetical protein
MTPKLLTALFLLSLLPSLVMGQTANNPAPPQLFGMHENHGATGQTAYPTVSFGSFRIWDVDGTLWSNLETSPGSYSWGTLDNWISTLNSHGVTDIIYTFGYTPSWCGPSQSLPCTNNSDFVNFITAICNRYCGAGPGKINHWEAWNEVTSSTFWTGTMPELVVIQNDVYNTIKSICPTCTVHTPVTGVAGGGSDCSNSGAGTFSLNNFVNAMTAANGPGNYHFDVVDLHFYPYPAGTMPETGIIQNQVANAICGMSNLGISSKPLWNTEFSWGINSTLSSTTNQAAFVARAAALLWSKGVARSYWYAYDNSQWGTLSSGSSLTAAGVAYEQVYAWLKGATLKSPCAANGTVYTCGLTESNGSQALIVWNTAGTSSYSVGSGYSQYRDLAGNTTSLSSGTVSIGSEPILLEGTGTTGTAPAPPSGLTATVS